MSMSASGKIADAIVYFTWKGRNVVRQWLVPANPQSTIVDGGKVTGLNLAMEHLLKVGNVEDTPVPSTVHSEKKQESISWPFKSNSHPVPSNL